MNAPVFLKYGELLNSSEHIETKRIASQGWQEKENG